jgi:hypothetical protein
MSANDYIEKCIAALPVDRQTLARQAVHDILEGSDNDGALTKLLVVFEMTAAYAQKAPAQMSMVLESHAKEWDGRLAKYAKLNEASLGALKSAMTETIRSELPSLAEKLAVTPLSEKVDAMRFSLDKLDRSIHRLRNVRLLFVSGLMIAAFLAGSFKASFLQLYYGLSIEATKLPNGDRRIQINTSQPFSDVRFLTDSSEQKIGVKLLWKGDQ